MATDATTYPVPLCACCERELAAVNESGGTLRDDDLGGPVCANCGVTLLEAEDALFTVGLTECAPLGPGLASGGLGACMAVATVMQDVPETDPWPALMEHGPAVAGIVVVFGGLLLLYGWLQRRAGRAEGRAVSEVGLLLDLHRAQERGMVRGYREAVLLLRAEGFLGADKLPGNLPAALEERGGRP